MSTRGEAIPWPMAVLSFAGIGIVLAVISSKLFTIGNYQTFAAGDGAAVTATVDLWGTIFTVGLALAALVVLGVWTTSNGRR